ncbi:hypothetical protein IFR04_011508 [Cadophora malorum]|uniref:Uncharacterized protein n=1 Tax=Cadophora malorum TaxID=108018 RepID=A0A8H7T8J2_9HELO|nr:hypothetical protein IFR04_011508 [Cadophora malorum]
MQSPVKNNHGEGLVIDQVFNVPAAQAANFLESTSQPKGIIEIDQSLHKNKRARLTDDEVLDPTYCPDRPDIPPVQAKRGRGRPRKEKPAGLEEVQAQLTELLQKQASERNRFQDELDAQREQLNELRKAMPRPQVIVIDEDEPDVQTVKERSPHRPHILETSQESQPAFGHLRDSAEQHAPASLSAKTEPDDANIYNASPSPVRNMLADEEPVRSATRVQMSVEQSSPEVTRPQLQLTTECKCQLWSKDFLQWRIWFYLSEI